MAGLHDLWYQLALVQQGNHGLEAADREAWRQRRFLLDLELFPVQQLHYHQPVCSTKLSCWVLAWRCEKIDVRISTVKK